MEMKALLLLLLVGLNIFYSAPLMAQVDLVVRMNENAFPTSVKTADGWQGMDVDVLEEMMSSTDLNFSVVAIPFKRAISEIAKGQIDIIANLTKNPVRSKDMLWIGPVRSTRISFIVLKKNQGPTINNVAELMSILETKHQQIGKVMGVSYSPLLDELLENSPLFNVHIWKSAKRKQIVEMLQKDRIFGFFKDEFEARSLIAANRAGAKNEFSDFAIRKSNIDNSLSGAYFGISKHLDKRIVDTLQKNFIKMQQDGTLQRISEKYSGKVEERFEHQK